MHKKGDGKQQKNFKNHHRAFKAMLELYLDAYSVTRVRYVRVSH